MVDIEAYPEPYEYEKLEFQSPNRPRSSRSPSPSRPRLRFRRFRYLYLRICVLTIIFILMFSRSSDTCTSRAMRGAMDYVASIGESISESLPFGQNQSPFLEQPRYHSWELIEDDMLVEEIDEPGRSEEWLRKQEDDAGIQRIQAVVGSHTINDTVIVIPARLKDMAWLDNLACRLSFLNLTNVLFWAMDGASATRLQEHGLRFYYNPLLEAQNIQRREAEEVINKIRLLDWVVRGGLNVLYLEPTVTLFKDPLSELEMDADVEIFMDEVSLVKGSKVPESPHFGPGLIWLKSSEKVSSFLNSVSTRLNAANQTDDTKALNWALYEDSRARPVTSNSSDSPSDFTFRAMSPLNYINHPTFEKDMHLHRLGYDSAFSLRDSNWDDERFYPTLVYIHPHDLERSNVQRRAEGLKLLESRIVERWRSLGWWELDSKGGCAYLASKADRFI
jgi:hypothetical protein